jgi:hypothetical protein
MVLRARVRNNFRFLGQAMPAFLLIDLWPPSSPDTSSVDYKTWDSVLQRVYQSCLNSIDALEQHVLEILHGMEPSTIVPYT